MKRIIYFLIGTMSLLTVSCKVSQSAVPVNDNSELNAKVQQLQEQLALKDSALAVAQQQLRDCRDSLAVYTFFNNNEITIFEDNSLEEKHLASTLIGKNMTTYHTIRMIVELKNKLAEVDQIIETKKNQQASKAWSNSQLNMAIQLEIQSKMNAIGELLNTIDTRDLTVLSTQQRAYYNKLAQHFDSVLNTYL